MSNYQLHQPAITANRVFLKFHKVDYVANIGLHGKEQNKFKKIDPMGIEPMTYGSSV